MGPSFGIDGSLMTSDDNWLRLFPDTLAQRHPARADQAEAGQPTPMPCATACARRCPQDVLVMTQADFVARENAYWNRATPIGYIFAFGAIMGFVVGAIIVYQILFADVSEHLSEYATLRAMGYPNRFVSGIVVQQAVHPRRCSATCPGWSLAHFLYGRRGRRTLLPLHITADRAPARCSC